MISVYTDGSSEGKKGTGSGGWGFVIVKDECLIRFGYGGGKTRQTNNSAELNAAIDGLVTAYNEGYFDEDVELVCDSQYVLGMASGDYNPSKNKKLVRALQRVVSLFSRLSFRWVRGHAGDTWNERCDRLAKRGRQEASESDQEYINYRSPTTNLMQEEKNARN